MWCCPTVLPCTGVFSAVCKPPLMHVHRPEFGTKDKEFVLQKGGRRGVVRMIMFIGRAERLQIITWSPGCGQWHVRKTLAIFRRLEGCAPGSPICATSGGGTETNDPHARTSRVWGVTRNYADGFRHQTYHLPADHDLNPPKLPLGYAVQDLCSTDLAQEARRAKSSRWYSSNPAR